MGECAAHQDRVDSLVTPSWEKDPERHYDELVKVAEPQRSRYGRLGAHRQTLAGATLLGDLGKFAALTHVFHPAPPLPPDPLSLLLDLASPPAGSSVAGTADDLLVCNCSGVSKRAIRACVAAGRREPSRAPPRAGRAGSSW